MTPIDTFASHQASVPDVHRVNPDLRSWLLALVSPRGLLLLAFISYFYLLTTLTFSTADETEQLWWLGMITAVPSLFILSYRMGNVVLNPIRARYILRGVVAVYLLLAAFLGAVTGWSFASLLDARFSIPAYGIVFSLYFVGAVLGTCAIIRSKAFLESALFSILFLYVGVIAGGKGFFAPAIFGLTLAVTCGFFRPRMKIVVPTLIAGIASVYFVVLSVVGDSDLVLAIVQARLIMSADAVSWLSSMSPRDIENFPITASTFALDLVTRLIGLRINPQSVGSVMASIVVGDDSGGGPNPTLPVLAFLVNQGDFAGAIFFVVVTMLMLTLVISGCRVLIRRYPGDSIYFAAIIFFAPAVIIDAVLFLQQVFCVIFFATVSKTVGFVSKR